MKNETLWLCHKKLRMDDGVVVFKKNKVYRATEDSSEATEFGYLYLINEEGAEHELGDWLEHFTKIELVDNNAFVDTVADNLIEEFQEWMEKNKLTLSKKQVTDALIATGNAIKGEKLTEHASRKFEIDLASFMRILNL
jgi:hypothetical protein